MTAHPNRPQRRAIDKLVIAIMASDVFYRIWSRFNLPDISVRMPPQRLPDGRKGYRVISIRRG